MDNTTEYSLLLHIIEGIRLNQKDDEISLNATLNGVKFEVIGQNTETTTVFNSNCIWECMSDDLKRMKTDNRPIKIECFQKTTKNEKEVKKAIGFILLPIRSLQMVKTLKNLQIKLHWHKLCGLSAEWRNAKPELYLSAIITTKELIETGDLEDFINPKPSDSSESIFVRPSETSLMLTSQFGIYVKLLEEECLLQIGNNNHDIDTFVVTLTLKRARNLDELVSGNPHPEFRLHYDFLGESSDSVLVANSDRIYNIHKKITIHIKSSLESLRNYFKRVFFIPLDLCYNDSIIGNYKLRFENLLPVSLEVFDKENVWKVEDSFCLQTIFGISTSQPQPMVDFVFCLSFIPGVRPPDIHQMEFVDIKARGDMPDNQNIIELPPTVIKKQSLKNKPVLHSAVHRVEKEIDENPKSSRSDFDVNYERNSPESPRYSNDKAYDIIVELEDWKQQQINEFLIELKRKEATHLNQLSSEWERQKIEMAKSLQDKLDECNRMTESLESAQAAVFARTLKQFEKEKAFEKQMHEMDKKYTVKFMEVEEHSRRAKNEMEYQLKLQDLKYRELLNEKKLVAAENEKLREKVEKLKEECEDLKTKYLPKEQLAGLLEDLRQQSEYLAEVVKSKKFYKEQWARVTKEAHVLKLQALRSQEEKIKHSRGFRDHDIMGIKNLILEEQLALITDQSELKTIKEDLTSDSDESKANYQI